MTQPGKGQIAQRTQPTVPANLANVPIGQLGVEITNAEQVWSICQAIASTEMVPKDCHGKPAACFAKAMMGGPLGFDLFTSIRRIDMFSGKPTLPAELMLALILRQPDRVHYAKGYSGKAYDDDYCAWIETQRKGGQICRSEFSVADAKQAGLWNAKDNWKKYPKAMLHARAVGIHAREYWADRMNGLQPSEDMRDEMPPMRDVTPRASAVSLILDEVESQPDPLLAEVVDVETGEVQDVDLDSYAEWLTELGSRLDDRAWEVTSQLPTGGPTLEQVRPVLKATLLAQAGVEKGAKPTLEQVKHMITLVSAVDLESK